MPDRTSPSLADLRGQRLVSQAALGKLIGCGQAAIHKYESGRVRLPSSVAWEIRQALGLSDAETVALLRWAAQVRPSRRRASPDTGTGVPRPSSTGSAR